MSVQEKRYTLQDLHEIESRPENADRIFELIDGEIIEKVPSFKPSMIAATLIVTIQPFVKQHQLGFVTGADGGYIMNDEGNVFDPDVGFISKLRMPQMPEREALVPPDFAIEVKSPTDRKRDMRLKAEKYLRFGTTMVWLVFPDEQQVEVYVRDQDVQTLGVDDEVDQYEVIPGISLAVRDV